MAVKRIKAESIKLFAKKGYAGTSVKDITQVIGITPPALYAHFKSKEELFFEVLSECWKELMANVEKVIEENREEGVYQVLYQIYLHYLNYYVQDKDRTIFILHSIMFPPIELKEKAVAIYLDSTQMVFRKIKEIFVEGMDRNLIKRLPEEEHLNIYTQVIHTYYFDIAALNRDLTKEEIEKAWKRYLDGIKAI